MKINILIVYLFLLLFSGCICEYYFIPTNMSKRQYRRGDEIKTKFFTFDCYSPHYAKENELYFSPNLYNAGSKKIKIICVIPFIPKENDTLKYSGEDYNFKYHGSIKEINRLSLYLQYSFVENNRRDTISELYKLKRKRGCKITVH